MKDFLDVAKRKVESFKLEKGYISSKMISNGLLKVQFTNGSCLVSKFGNVTWL